MALVTFVPGSNSVTIHSFVQGLNRTQITAAYNALMTATGGKPVKSFKDATIAATRLEAALEAVIASGKTFQVGIGDDNSAEVAVHEKAAPPVKGQKPARKTPVGRASNFPDTHVITIVVDKNPRREGSAAATRFSCYTSGMTVAAYVAAAAKAVGGKDPKKAIRRARRSLNKDVLKGHVTVAPAAGLPGPAELAKVLNGKK